MEENTDKIQPRNIEDEMHTSYLDYAMSVIVGRALPDVRDGLKPVHRRILFTMKEMGLKHNQPYKKSARVVGDVLGKYHPHGDTAVYESMVRMAQDFSLRYTLIDGQGNFGSIDGDPPAAMRYTEVRLNKIAEEILEDIDKNTVDFIPNYDGSLTEPVVLPAKLPNLLINGSNGIAVGMATNIPTHNLGEIIDGIISVINNNDITTQELIKIIKGPDFPTGAYICGREGIKNYFETGKGSITIRAKAEIEDIKGGKQAIIITELPYQVNKAQLIETIANLVKNKQIEDISDIRDESDRDGIRIVIEIKRDGNANVVLNQLFKHTQLQTSFGVIMLALVDGQPKILSMKNMLNEYLKHRRGIIIRRTKFELEKAEKRAHILEGLKIAIDNLNKIIKIIRESKDTETACKNLMDEFKFTKIQAQAILDMKLHQLTGLERKKLEEEYLELIKTIEKLKSVLSDPKKVDRIICDELEEIKKNYNDTRKTKIIGAIQEMDFEDLVQKEDVVVTFSHAGYIKRLPLSTYRSQKRGGKGMIGVTTREEDFIKDLFITNTHSYMLFFTNKGKVFSIRVAEIPEGSRISKGKAVINLIQLSGQDEKITAAISIKSFEEEKGSYLLMCTRNGTIKKTLLEKYSDIRKTGIIGIKLEKDNILTDVKHITDENSQIIIGTRKGIAIRFKQQDIKPQGRATKGVRGIKLSKDDYVIGMEVVSKEDKLLTVTENGFGKRTEIDKYRLQKRGGKGVINIKTSQRNGDVIGLTKANKEDELIFITVKGIMIRMKADEIRLTGRNAIGVRLVKLNPDDKIADVSHIITDEEQEKTAEVQTT